MAVTSITATTSSSRLCHYVLNGVAHDGSGEGRYVFASGVGCFAPIAPQAFAITRAVRGQHDVTRQAYSIVQSFGKEEFDPDDVDAADRVHELGLELARRAFPGHQALVVTQHDGKSGLLHNHIVVSNISDRDAELVYRRKPRKTFSDKFALMKETNPDGLIEVREKRHAGRAFSSAMGNRHRLAHVNDELLADMEFTRSLGLSPYDNKALMATPLEKVTKDDRAKREAGDYVWRDDLKSIISEEQLRAVSVDDFRDRLTARRVELRERGKEEHFSYGFIDAEGKSRQARGLGVRGLGASFGREATVPMLERNQIAKDKATNQSIRLIPATVQQPGTKPSAGASPTPVQVDQSVVPAAHKSARSWMDNAIADLDSNSHDGELSRSASESVAESVLPDYSLEPVVPSTRPREPATVAAPAVKSKTKVRKVAMTPEQKIAISRVVEMAESEDEDDRTL